MRVAFWKPPPPTPARASSPTFDEVYEQAFRTAFRTLRAKGVRGEADLDDACQEVFIIVDQLLRKGTIPRKLKAWVAGIAFTVAGRYRRKRMRDEARLDYDADPATVAAPDEEAEPEAERRARAREDLVLSLIEEIANDQQREVIILHYLAEQTVAEIMAELGRPEGTVKSQIQAGLRAMEAALRRRNAREGAAVVPMYGVIGLLESLRGIEAPEDARARVRGRLRELGCGGGGDGGGGGRATPATPPAPPLAPLSRAAAPSLWTGTTIFGAVALVEACIIAGLLWGPHRAPVEARPDAVIAAVRATPSVAPAPTAPPSASEAPSLMATAAALPHDLSAGGLRAEQIILALAQEALKGGHVDEALAAIDDHFRIWHGGGILAAKRESLRAQIERYAAAHRNDAAAEAEP